MRQEQELLQEHKRALEKSQQSGDEVVYPSDSERGGGSDLPSRALKSKKAEYARKEMSRQLALIKNRASNLTSFVPKADLVAFGMSGSSTKRHLHVTGQHSTPMSDVDRSHLSKIIALWLLEPGLRSDIVEAV